MLKARSLSLLMMLIISNELRIIVGKVGSKEGIDTLKEDLVTLFKWFENW